MKPIITLLASVATIVVSQAQTILIQQPDAEIGKDAIIGNYVTYVDLNMGDVPEFHAWAWTAGGLNTDMRALIQFDLTSIPAGSIINDAKLSLFYDDSTWFGGGVHTGDNEAFVSRIIESWDENTVTWNSQPAVTEINRITLEPSASPTQNYQIKVKKLVQDMVDDPDNSFGFMLQLADETQYKSLLFCSSDNTDLTKHPKLRINYSEPMKIANTNENKMMFSPNPFSESTTLYFENPFAEPFSLRLLDLQGKVVYQQENNSGSTITILKNNLPSGIYLWNLISSDNKVESGKVVVM